ncbi:NADH dehydrogenase 1 beta subcomplex subunit 3 [Papiliotrema laurentii]|uniref:NADH dehydrogenase 1 beta subcomplex subunit 3 n=1 Tax=Papiliotrema laurentii TaxID=5418 RepID=A0AAD9CUT4_PAPLA|nr:NADH dehydrogenase 1 beta subcomplex subunit 3 [Papiliotrema laurentii]
MPGPLYRDPWAQREAWRRHPIFSKRTQFKAMFPGLGWATAAFVAYVVYDDFIKPKSAHH